MTATLTLTPHDEAADDPYPHAYILDNGLAICTGFTGHGVLFTDDGQIKVDQTPERYYIVSKRSRYYGKITWEITV